MSSRVRRRGVGFLVLLMLCALGAAARPLAAQERGTIQGQVSAAATGRPLAGVSVFVPGTPVATTTNSDGRFLLLNVPAGEATVRAEFLGYGAGERTVTVVAGQTVTAAFELREAAIELDAVVVTGTAAGARSREIGNSISQIDQREIEVAPVRNAQDIIAGRAPGVTVMSNSGQPGAGGTIRLRGNNSVSQGNEPLIYVDGVRVFGGRAPAAWASRQRTLPFNDINPEDIERIEIVKGPSATTLYGTEASGGVIQIFTKKGRAGAASWSAEIGAGINNLGHVGPEEDPTGLFLNKCTGPELQDSEGDTWVDATCPESGSWLRNGLVQRYSASVRGGANDLTYFFSGNYADEEGAIETGQSRDGGFRANFSFRPRQDLDFALNSSYSRRVTRWVPDGNNASGFLLNVMRGNAGNFKDASQCADDVDTCTINGEILTQNNFNRNDHFVTGFTVRHQLNDQVTNRLVLGYDYNAADNHTHYPYGFSRVPLGFIWGQLWQRTAFTVDYVGSFSTDFGSSLISQLSWGGQLVEDRNRYTTIDSEDFAGPGEPTLISGARRSVTGDTRFREINAGFFFEEKVGWNDRLFVTAGLRVDGNSAFGDEFGLQPYPKLSASYVLSDHDFWPVDTWETLKLRAAVGESGKAPGAFDAVKTWDPIAADDGQPAVTPNQLGNPELGPERTREYEVGFETSAFEGRLGVDFTFYNQRTLEALIGVLHPPSDGFLARQLENIGETKNSGVELRVDLGLIRTASVEWDTWFNLGTNKTEAVDLGGEEVPLGVQNYAIEGQPLPVVRGDLIINPDAIEEPIVVSDTVIGPGYPTRTMGVGSSIRLLGRVTLDVLGEWQGGHYLANWVGYQNARRGVWYPCYEVQAKLRAFDGGDASALNGVTALERAKCAINRRKMNDDYWIQPADFFKLRSASLTYQLPSGLIPGTSSASLTLAGRNLWTVTDYDGVDPEVADISDSGFGRREYYNLPPLRTFLATLRVNF